MVSKQHWSNNKDCIFVQSASDQCKTTWSSPCVRRHMAFEVSSDTYTIRSRMGHTQQRHLDVQKHWISGEGTQNNKKGPLHTKRTISSSRRTAGQLQKKNSIQARWNTWGLWGEVPGPSTTTEEQKTPRTSMVRRNMAQGQRNNKTSSTTVAQGTSSNSSSSISNTKSTRSQGNDKPTTAATSAAAYRISSPISRKEASGTTFGTTAAANEATNIPRNSSSRTQRHTSNSRLLDQGRAILEESPCTTTDSTWHSTTNNGRSRCHKATATTTNNSQTNIRSRGYRIDDDWTPKTSATMNFAWTGSTNFGKSTAYKEEYYNIDEEEHLDARTAKGIKAPDQPTAQERAEHELTHLPYRSWFPTCVQNTAT